MKSNIEAIEALCEAASPEPWEVVESFPEIPIDQFWLVAGGCMPLACFRKKQGKKDAAFVAACRTDIPALIAYARELEEALGVIYAHLDYHSDEPWFREKQYLTDAYLVARKAVGKDNYYEPRALVREP